MRILILSAYTKEVVWNNYGKCDFGELSTINHKEYAEKHGYSYHCEIVDAEDYPNMHLTWLKIYILRKFIEHYDYVVWIDADAVFVNKNLSIDNFIKANTDLIVPKMEEDRENDRVWTGISTGFMILRNSKHIIALLESMINYEGPLKYGGFHEQEYLSNLVIEYFLADEWIPDWYTSKEDIIGIKTAYPKEGLSIAIIPKKYHRCYSDGDMEYIFHAGGDTPSKLKRIKEALDDKH